MDSKPEVRRWTPNCSPTPWTPGTTPSRPLHPQAGIEHNDDQNGTALTYSNIPRFPFGDYILPPSMQHQEFDEELDDPEYKKNKAIQLNQERRFVAGFDDGSRTDCGVFLSWKDLLVTASYGGGGHLPILSELTGFARSGELLAIMGPSGCGKSTLLDSLAGRLGSNFQCTGEILLNGHKQSLSFGASAYVTQDDVLMTTLTVQEAVYYSAQLQLPGTMSTVEKRQRAEATIREMGLWDSMNTRIGGPASKGISGGQRRRVSICLEILTRPPLLFLDEPTSGLDSAASYHVMSQIVNLAKRERMTVVAVVHQPSSEVAELFNGLCLLAYGRTLWFGSPSMTSEFFALNGFPCPPLRNPFDHYIRTINKDFDALHQDIEAGTEAKSTTTTDVIGILVKSYRLSQTSQEVSLRIAEIGKTGGALLKRKTHASFFTQSLILVRRSFVNMYRDLGYYWLRFAIYIMLCLCLGTIYHNVGNSFDSIQARCSMLMFVSSYMAFMAIGGFPSFVEEMKIFRQEWLNGHYDITSFVVGNTISSTPYLAVISVIPGALAYYLAGLQSGISHFAFFALVLFMCMMLVESLMMIIASIVPDFLMGIIIGAGIQGVMMLNAGFFQLPDNLPKFFWRYPMYYISFHKYASQGLYKNEFIGLNFPINQAGGAPTITGELILKDVFQVEMDYSKWIDLLVIFGMVILYRILFLAILKISEKFKSKAKALWANSPTQAKLVMEQASSATSY